MKKLLLSKVCALSAIAILTFSCKKEEVNEKVKLKNEKAGLAGTTVVSEDIYVTGYGSSPSLHSKYWVNIGTPTTLASNSYANSIAISASTNDVFIAGSEATGTPAYQSARYWKNGVGVWLPLPSGASSASTARTFISGSDVYIAGTANFSGANSRAIYWKITPTATTVTLVGTSSYNNSGKDVTVIGTDVYVSGTKTVGSVSNVSVYWKNGTEYSTASTHRGAPAIAGVGTDFYLAVSFGDEYHIYKNGTEITSTLTGGPGRLTAFPAFSVVGTDIYISVTGSYATGTGEYRIFVWKNSGSPIYVISKALGSAGLENTSGSIVATVGGAVFAAGRDNLVHCYWRNGVKYNLSGTANFVTGLAIQYN